MTVVVTLKGALEPVTLEDDFLTTANALNMASAQGKEFVVTRTDRGDNILLAMDQILHIIEGDD
jgi:hypothetical protein